MEFIKLTKPSYPNLPIGESLVRHEPLFKEIARHIIRLAADRSRNCENITFMCDDSESVILATTIAHMLNTMEYQPTLQVTILTTLMSLEYAGEGTMLVRDYYIEGMFIIVQAHILEDATLVNFKDAVDVLVEEGDNYYQVLLTINPFVVDELYPNSFIPKSIAESSDNDLKVHIRECLGHFGWCIGI